MKIFVILLFASIYTIVYSFSELEVIPAEIINTVKNEDMGHLEWLLGEGVNPDYYDPEGDRWTPLIFAVSQGKTEFVSRLLRARANPNQAEKDGWTRK